MENGKPNQIMRIQGKNTEARTKLRLRMVEEHNQSKIRIRLSNGDETTVNIMPDEIYEKVRKRLNTKNISLELEEKIHKNIPRVIYNIKANKNGRFLGIFKTKIRLEGEIDSETGEVLKMHAPWWSALVVKENNPEDESNEERENEIEEVENETNLSN
jgi:hypothetical protein